MPIDQATVRRIARLARIRLADDEVPQLASELNSIFSWIEKLDEVDTTGIEPMTSVVEMKMKCATTRSATARIPDGVLANAPRSEDHLYLVPKVVE